MTTDCNNDNDKLSGTSGADTISGGAGNDKISGGSGNDSINGGAGNDKISGGSGNDVIDGGAGNDKISGGSGNDSINGGAGNDKISGGSGNDSINGGAGNDKISGGSGNDVIMGGAGNDKISGGSGNDAIYGGDGNDKIDGGKGDDLLDGGSGNDKLDGGSGNDTLIGGAGADTLTGGSGKDVFVYLDASDSTTKSWDRITDFTQGQDKIDLVALLGSDNLAWGNKTALKNGIWFQYSGSSTFVLADTTGDGAANFKIELLDTKGLKLTVNDFIGVGNSNAAPVISSGAQVATVTEITDNASGENIATHQSNGKITFTDANAADTHTAAFAPQGGGVGYLGAFSLDPVDPNLHSLAWNFSVSDSALDFLASGEVRTQKYDVTVSDGYGGTAVQTVTVTLNGTNDAPVLTISDTSGNLIEDDGAPTLSDSGGLGFADPDSNDVVTVSQTYNDDIAWSGGTINPGLANKLVKGFSVDQDSWDYSTSENLDFLGKGQTITFSYDVVATDDSGAGNDASATKTVTVTLTGTNDAPVAKDDKANVSGVDASGNVLDNDFDVDFGDTVTFTGFSSRYTGDAGELDDPLFGEFGHIVFDSQVPGHWAYQAASAGSGVDYFDYTIADGNGGTASGTLTITVPGKGAPSVVTSSTSSTDSLTTDTGAPSSGTSSTGSTPPTTPGTGANSAPDAVADDAYAPFGNVLANDTDVDGDLLNVTAISFNGNVGDLYDPLSGDYGFLIIDESGSWTYTPTSASGGDDVFDYTIADGHGGMDSSTLTIHSGDFIL